MKNLLPLFLLIFSIDISAQDFDCGTLLLDTRDSTFYETVQIGTQCWMAENLNYGMAIDLPTQQTDNELPEKFCYDNELISCDTFGGLYQWKELMQYDTVAAAQGLCPDGWHIPTDEEWKELELFLGMDPVLVNLVFEERGNEEGVKLQPEGNIGFDALFGGSVNGMADIFGGVGVRTYFWTSTRSPENDKAFIRGISSEYDGIYRGHGTSEDFERYAYRVRCILNEPVTGTNKEINKNLLKLYPNPTSGILNLKWNTPVVGQQKIQLFDPTGRLVKEVIVNDQLTEFNLSFLPNGIYLIKVINGKGSKAYKVIKK